jgi:predicted ester cyclase
MANDNRQLTRRLMEEVWNNGKLQLLEELLDPAFEGRDPLMGPLKPEQYRNMVKAYRTAFPDIRFEIQAVVADGSFVTTRWAARCTHLGPFLGNESTGRSAFITGINMAELRNGKVLSEYSEWDLAALLRQLDLVGITVPLAVRRPQQQQQRSP